MFRIFFVIITLAAVVSVPYADFAAAQSREPACEKPPCK